MKNIIRKEMNFAGKSLVLETGEIAHLANLAVMASYGDTVVLATVVSGGQDPERDYFPLSVNYEERLFASGLIKNSRFIKRDGRPSDDSTVTRRLIDHAIRPLFPNDFMDDVQVGITVLSLDPEADVEFLSMVAASAALHASDIPFKGPMTTAKVGIVDGEYIMCPSWDVMHSQSDLEMVVSFVGEDQKFLAIECEAQVQPENKVLGAIEFARTELKPMVKLLNEFAEAVNPGGKKYEYTPFKPKEDVVDLVKGDAGDKIREMFATARTKTERQDSRNEIIESLVKTHGMDEGEVEVQSDLDGKYEQQQLEEAYGKVEKKIIQKLILEDGIRPDGRNIDQLREISCKVGLLPRTHGSALFNRGETQALTVATLGNPSLEQTIQDMYGERTKRYIHYYNFPPYSTGETGRWGGVNGRMIGHGMLAEKGLRPVVPDPADFPYMILLNTEITASNGSSSMASTCGSTLALMDAGVPIKEMVAGISIGLVADEENDKYVLLTDIQGLEDWTGHMDFKIAGTKTGVTAIQLDMKVQGIPMELLPKVFEKAKTARLEILEAMKAAIAEPRAELSKYAPRMRTIKIQPDQVGMVIGSGGKTIKEIQEKTGTELALEDDGTVFITGPSAESVDQAYEIVHGMTKEIEVGEIYDGVVEGITDFGAFVEVLPGRSGLLHLSEINFEYVENVEDYLSIGQEVKVKVIETGDHGKFSLSMKALMDKPEGYVEPERGNRSHGNGGGRDRGGRGGDRRGGRNGGDRHGGRGGDRRGGNRR